MIRPLFLIHVEPDRYFLIRPDGTTCATFPRDPDPDRDDVVYAAGREIQDAMNDRLLLTGRDDRGLRVAPR